MTYKHVHANLLFVIFLDCTNSADLFFVLDGSGSIDESHFETMKEFTVNLVDDLAVSILFEK